MNKFIKNVNVVTYDTHTGDDVSTSKVELRLCPGENPPIFEIMVINGESRGIPISQAIYIPVSDVLDLINEGAKYDETEAN